MTWNAAKEEQEVDAQKPPLPHDQAERTVQRIFELISMEGLLMKFHATRPMVQTYKSEVLPFVTDSLQPREPGAAQPLSNPVQQRLPLPGRDSHASRSHEEAAPGGSSQRKGLQPPGCDQSVPGYEDRGRRRSRRRARTARRAGASRPFGCRAADGLCTSGCRHKRVAPLLLQP